MIKMGNDTIWEILKHKVFFNIGIVLGYPWAWIANTSDGNGMNTSQFNYTDVNLGLKVMRESKII